MGSKITEGVIVGQPEARNTCGFHILLVLSDQSICMFGVKGHTKIILGQLVTICGSVCQRNAL